MVQMAYFRHFSVWFTANNSIYELPREICAGTQTSTDAAG
jgi:hypothetical protein